MTEKIRGLIAARREQLAYLVVGVMTTVINYIIYVLLTEGISLHYAASNVIAWAAAVAFSYFANGKWVYRSASRRSLREAGEFVLSRLFSLGLETVLLLLLVDLLHADKLIAKLLVAVVVVVVNYLTGLLVFKRKKPALSPALPARSGKQPIGGTVKSNGCALPP